MTGIDGVVVHTNEEVLECLDRAAADQTIGVLLITEKLAHICQERLGEMKLHTTTPLVVEIPDRHGTGRAPDSITRYVKEAIGIKI